MPYCLSLIQIVDGEISFSEASKITDMEGMFPYDEEEGTIVRTFREFKHFTGVTEIVGARCLPRYGDITFPDTLVSCVTAPDVTRDGGVNLYGMYNYFQLKHIGRNFFGYCRLERTPHIKLPNIEVIEPYAFTASRIKSLDLTGAPIKVLSDGAFWRNGYLNKVTFNEGLEVIGHQCFEIMGGNSLVNDISLIFPNSLKSIGGLAFASARRLINIKLNEGLEIIGSRAFGDYADTGTMTIIGDPSIRYNKVTIPSTVTTIGSIAFGGDLTKLCPKVTFILLPETPPTLSGLITRGTDDEINDFVEMIYVPVQSVGRYKSASIGKVDMKQGLNKESMNTLIIPNIE